MSPIVFSNPSHVVMQDEPIRPDWVVEGSPHARSRVLSASDDGYASTVLWDCTAGVFNWHFTYDETVHIVEGEVEITDADGFHKVLRAGDVAFFPAGSSSLWRVTSYVRKIAFCRTMMPRALTKTVSHLRALKARLKGLHVPSGLAQPQFSRVQLVVAMHFFLMCGLIAFFADGFVL